MSDDDIDIGGSKTRMEVAYGAGDGDDEAKAIVASKEAELGAIFEQSYRPWDGDLGPRWVRNYAIFRHHVYGLFRGTGHRHYHPMVRLTIFVILLFSLLPVLMLFLASLSSDGFMAATISIGLFSLAGLPFFAGFTTKVYLFTAAANQDLLWLAGLAIFNSLIRNLE